MATALLRIFHLYKLLHSLLPKNLRSFLSSLSPTTATTATTAAAAALPENPAAMDPAELKRIFQMFDRNGDGRISKKELTDSLENLGIFISDSDLADIIGKIDVNGDGFVDIDEFETLYLSILEGRDDEEDMREAFNVFDQNGDGFITVDELRSVLDSLGMNGRTVDECKTMITKVDVDGDGRVDYKEFRKMMKGGGLGSVMATDA